MRACAEDIGGEQLVVFARRLPALRAEDALLKMKLEKDEEI